MIRVLIEGDDNRAKHLYVQYLRGSAQGMRTATDQEIIVVTDDDLVPEDLAGIELLIENRSPATRTDGPWRVNDPTVGLIEVHGGDEDDLVCVVHDDQNMDGNAAAIARVPMMEAALEAVLMFHSASPWTGEKRERWRRLTTSDEATTRTLCDFVRRSLA